MPHVYCSFLHMKQAKMVQSNCHLSCLSEDQKLFNATVMRGAIYCSKCTRNCLVAGLHPDTPGELTALSLLDL